MTSELATSSYGQFRPSMGVPVRITLGKPKMKLAYRYEEIRELAPKPRLFALRDNEEFEREYRRHLDRLGVDRLRAIFEAVRGKHDDAQLVLLCFENVLAGESCHRRIFSGWWQEKTGEEIPELNPEDYRTPERLF